MKPTSFRAPRTLSAAPAATPPVHQTRRVRRQTGYVHLWLLALFGGVLNLAVLFLPVFLWGQVARAVQDPRLWLFAAGATLFYLADVTTLFNDRRGEFRSTHDQERVTNVARAAAMLVVLIFWAGLLSRVDSTRQSTGIWPFIGGCLMAVGVGLRWSAIRALRCYFVTEICVRPAQPLVQHGVYGFVRHPSETGLIAIVIGASLLLQSPLGLLICGLLLPVIQWRVRNEDRQLRAVFGDVHLHYARRVKALIPGLF